MPDKDKRYCFLFVQANKYTPHEVKHHKSVLILACAVISMQVDLALSMAMAFKKWCSIEIMLLAPLPTL